MTLEQRALWHEMQRTNFAQPTPLPGDQLFNLIAADPESELRSVSFDQLSKNRLPWPGPGIAPTRGRQASLTLEQRTRLETVFARFDGSNPKPTVQDYLCYLLAPGSEFGPGAANPLPLSSEIIRRALIRYRKNQEIPTVLALPVYRPDYMPVTDATPSSPHASRPKRSKATPLSDGDISYLTSIIEARAHAQQKVVASSLRREIIENNPEYSRLGKDTFSRLVRNVRDASANNRRAHSNTEDPSE